MNTIRMNPPKCHQCKNPLKTLLVQLDNGTRQIETFGYCTSCEQPREISAFYRKFGFEPFEKQDGKDKLSVAGHELVWKEILGQEQYYCLTCDSELLHSHHHHHA
ncbi:MAG: hypothetical protein D6732_21940 [Methanobacteriota archaeon]|nr:MAG: hypothetical protein D6732_21940 [Euryarchaeota archaeon]